MPRKKGPSMSRSLFASLPHELRETIRIQGALPAVRPPTAAPPVAPAGHVSFTQLEQARNGQSSSQGYRTGGEMELVPELVRTQPESPDSSDSSDMEEEEEQVESKGQVGSREDGHDLAIGSSGAQGAASGVLGSSAIIPDRRSDHGEGECQAPIPPAERVALQEGSTAVTDPSIHTDKQAIGLLDSQPAAGAPKSAVRSVKTEGTWVPAEDYNTQAVVPRKKRKKNNGYVPAPVVYNAYAEHPYDCTGLMERYNDYKGVPMDIRKYYAQRHLMFAEYDELPLLLDHTGWFSVTPQPIARHIAERCRCDVIVDAFCGIGGNAIEFAKTCERVIAIDNDLTRLKLARHNALQYGLADRIEFIHGSYIDFARAYAASNAPDKEAIDVVFLSPPWGGVDYLTFTADPLPFPPSPLPKSDAKDASATSLQTSAPPKYPLSAIEPIHGADLFRLSLALTPNIAYYLPKNTSLQELADLAPPLPVKQADGGAASKRDREWVEVEEEWVGEKVKAITAYYGSLVSESGMAE